MSLDDIGFNPVDYIYLNPETGLDGSGVEVARAHYLSDGSDNDLHYS